MHTQWAYEYQFPGIFGIVVQINSSGQLIDYDCFVLTEFGHLVVQQCGLNSNQARLQHESCSSPDLYRSIKNSTKVSDEVPCAILNFMNKSIDVEIERSKNAEEMVVCRGCKKPLKANGLLRHLGQKLPCQTSYGDDYEELKKKSKAAKVEAKKKSDAINYSRNRASIIKKTKQYKEKNKEKVKAQNSSYKERNKDKISEYREKNREKINEKCASYDLENKERRAEKSKQRRLKKKMVPMLKRIMKFKADIKDGPIHVCKSCKRGLFKKSIKILTQKDLLNLRKKGAFTMLRKVFYKQTRFEDKYLRGTYLCHNCWKYICKKKLPKISEVNGLKVERVPEELSKMKDLEEQLIALDLIFMIIKNLPSRRCRAMKNKIVNVPLDSKDVQETVKSLPRPPEKASIVPVRFKR